MDSYFRRRAVCLSVCRVVYLSSADRFFFRTSQKIAIRARWSSIVVEEIYYIDTYDFSSHRDLLDMTGSLVKSSRARVTRGKPLNQIFVSEKLEEEEEEAI